MNRLKDEPKVVAILEKGQKLLEAKNSPASDMCRIYLKRIEHIYFKFDPKVVQQKNVSELFNYCDPTGFTPAKAVTVRLHFWVESSEAFAISIS